MFNSLSCLQQLCAQLKKQLCFLIPCLKINWVISKKFDTCKEALTADDFS